MERWETRGGVEGQDGGESCRVKRICERRRVTKQRSSVTAEWLEKTQYPNTHRTQGQKPGEEDGYEWMEWEGRRKWTERLE